ncbi:MAG: YebC/PmpR family DNA-binding transcriptional regulator [Coriobacteriia bacterium]
MAGHSKWATTKHRKAAQDKKRSALFSKLSRNIYVAAKEGGSPDPDNNAALAAAIEKAKSYSLPKDRIEAAINKAFGGGEAESYEEVVYEGYGPGGIAVYVTALTDNRNRTAADVRSAFTRAGGNLASTGAVAFQFERKGEITVRKETAPDEEELLLAVMEAGGDDLEDDGEVWTVVTDPAELVRVRNGLEQAGVEVSGAELVMKPNNLVALDVGEAKKVVRLVETLEDLDDVQDVYHNLELTDELAAALDAE